VASFAQPPDSEFISIPARPFCVNRANLRAGYFPVAAQGPLDAESPANLHLPIQGKRKRQMLVISSRLPQMAEALRSRCTYS
jgi:hypothetical protein